MAKLMQELQRHGKFPFELVFLVMNPGYNEDNWKIIQDNAKLLDIPLTVFESDIFNIVAEVDRNPCYLCAISIPMPRSWAATKSRWDIILMM